MLDKKNSFTVYTIYLQVAHGICHAPLIHAILHDRLDVMRLLIEHGADLEIEERDRLDVMRLLIEHGADIEIED